MRKNTNDFFRKTKQPTAPQKPPETACSVAANGTRMPHEAGAELKTQPPL